MMTGDRKHDLMSDINVTPFVDVMLVLLIIFMVTAPMMIQGEDITLPTTVSQPLPAEEDNIIVTVDKTKRIFINEYEVDLDRLSEKLKVVLHNTQNDGLVYFRADRSVLYGDVVQVMAEVKKAGVTRLGMVTQPPEKPSE